MKRHFSIKQAGFKQKYLVGGARKKATQDLKKQSKYLRGENIAKAVIECTNKYNIPLDKILSVSTDGDKSMAGIRKGFVAILKEKIIHDILIYHCIIHQEALCAQTFPGDLC